jgi:hypothetical protein
MSHYCITGPSPGFPLTGLVLRGSLGLVAMLGVAVVFLQQVSERAAACPSLGCSWSLAVGWECSLTAKLGWFQSVNKNIQQSKPAFLRALGRT